LEEQIEYLTKIQEIDIQISEVLKQQEIYPKKIKELNNVLKEDREILEGLINSFEENEKERKKLQSHIDVNNERIERVQNKLPLIKTNKEYQAICKELDNMKKEIKSSEDRLLELLEEEEILKEKINVKENTFKEEEKDINLKISGFDDEISKFDERIDKFKNEKKRYSRSVNHRNIEIYERIKKRRDGIAIVPAIKGVCQGCFMNIPPQLFNMIIKSKEINTCPNCNRILYWREG
jgi:predicted  nucleic acid-binding Zn-ribbon protein